MPLGTGVSTQKATDRTVLGKAYRLITPSFTGVRVRVVPPFSPLLLRLLLYLPIQSKQAMQRHDAGCLACLATTLDRISGILFSSSILLRVFKVSYYKTSFGESFPIPFFWTVVEPLPAISSKIEKLQEIQIFSGLAWLPDVCPKRTIVFPDARRLLPTDSIRSTPCRAASPVRSSAKP